MYQNLASKTTYIKKDISKTEASPALPFETLINVTAGGGSIYRTNFSYLKMNGVLGHDSVLVRLYWTTWANAMNLLGIKPLMQDQSLEH